MNILQINENILPQLYEKYNSKGFNTDYIPFNNFIMEIIKPEGKPQRTEYKIYNNIIEVSDGPAKTIIKLKCKDISFKNSSYYKLLMLISDGEPKREYNIPVVFSDFINNIELYLTNVKIADINDINAPEAEQVKEAAAQYIGVLNMVFNYIMDDKQVKYITSSRTPQTRSAGNKKNKKNKKTVKYITNTKYIIKNITSSEKRAYNKTCDAWDVRGHWRTYKKSGRRVWVAGYKKGNKEKNTLNHYKIK